MLLTTGTQTVPVDLKSIELCLGVGHVINSAAYVPIDWDTHKLGAATETVSGLTLAALCLQARGVICAQSWLMLRGEVGVAGTGIAELLAGWSPESDGGSAGQIRACSAESRA